MALNRYKCIYCDKTKLGFREPSFQLENCKSILPPYFNCTWVKLPPNIKVIAATAQYMQEYQLDSWNTVYELDRILNIEAREEKEMDVYQHFKKNM